MASMEMQDGLIKDEVQFLKDTVNAAAKMQPLNMIKEQDKNKQKQEETP